MIRFRMYPLKSNNVIQLFQQWDLINLDPTYQRLSNIWNKAKKQTFIDSVINGFDIPKLYFHEIPSKLGQANQCKFAVIDGKQRLMTIWEFMSNQLPLAKDFVFFEDENLKAGGTTYDDLISKFPRLRARFDSFDVPVTVVQTDDEDFIEELFARLNIQVPLSAAERRNALGGPLPLVIRKVGLSPFFMDSIRIRNDRLQHFDLAAKFLYLSRVNGIESTKKDTLDNFVREFKRLRNVGELAASKETIEVLELRTRGILDRMRSFFGSKDALLDSQGRTTLYFHIFRILDKMGLPIPFSKEMLERFNDEVTAARKKSQRRAEGSQEELTELESLLIYFDREKQSPNDGGALTRQYNYLRDYFSSVFQIQLPDPD